MINSISKKSKWMVFIVRLKFQKRSVLKFVSRTISRCGGYNTPQLALGFIPVILTGMLFLLLA